MSSAGATHVGLQRSHNEDSFKVIDWLDLYVVADGMGGHRSGDIASRMATEAVADFFQEQLEDAPTLVTQARELDAGPSNALSNAIRSANQRIYEHGLRHPMCRGMGTTVVAATYFNTSNRIHIGHVGDSRAYRLRSGELQQLTRDHSLLNDYLARSPDLTARERAEIPKNVITRALGVGSHVEVDVIIDEPQGGDTYLLCSDGLHGMVPDHELVELATGPGAADVATLCEQLVERANENGGDDNITVVALRFLTYAEDVESEPTLRRPPGPPSSSV